VNEDGSLALVTGAGSGIGRATAAEVARRGGRVVCVDIDRPAAERTAMWCERLGAKETDAFAVDVADRDAVADLEGSVRDRFGIPDLLVNSAGVGLTGPFLATELEDWDWILGVNLLGVVHCCRAFGRPMVEGGRGHVVNIASGLAYTPRATEPAYVATKAAVLALSRSLRADWAPLGVGVTVVCPGLTDTAIVRHSRFRGSRADPAVAVGADRFFSKWGLPPAAVARTILRAVSRNRAVVPVGVEAWLAWWASKLLPPAVTDRLARIAVP
jgi:2-hydroxycyclohexanecarboxyl-CoA dehydrogenase